MEELSNILNEAKECLNCKNPLCRKGCPIETKIPDFINAIKNEEFEMAYEILQENNIMSDICSNVCPHEEYCMRTLCKRYKRKTCKYF